MKKIDISKTKDVFKAYSKIDFNDVRKKYNDPGTNYAFNVLDGKIIAGYDIQLACFRHVRDLQMQNTKDMSFYYGVNYVAKILSFASLCPEVNSGVPVDLMDWQKFILSQLVGWRDMKTREKRFTNAIISVARHNGKTYLMAIVICYAYLIESMGLNNLEFLVSSIDAQQSNQLVKYIKTMLQKLFTEKIIRGSVNPFKGLNEMLGINLDSLSTQSQKVFASKTKNQIIRITFNSGTYNGYHFTTAIGDEFGDPSANDSTKLTSITSGQTLGVKNPQFIRISTAYEDPNVEFHRTEQSVMESVERDYKRDKGYLRYLVLNWCQDDESEVYKQETWAKSNPLINLVGQKEKFIESIKNSRDQALEKGELGSFQNKTMNVWTQTSDASYLKLDDIEAAISTDIFDIDGRDVYVGFDGSISGDNSSIVFLYPYVDEKGNNRYHLEQHSWIPWYDNGSIQAKEKSDSIPYRELAKRGLCEIANDPGVIDYDSIYRWVMSYLDEHNLKVKFFGIDAAAQASSLMVALINSADFDIMPIRQIPSELSEPTTWLRERFIYRNIDMPDDQILEKSFLNSIIRTTSMGIRVDKGSRRKRIDPVDAAIDAAYQGKWYFEEFSPGADKNAYEDMSPEELNEWIKNNYKN